MEKAGQRIPRGILVAEVQMDFSKVREEDQGYLEAVEEGSLDRKPLRASLPVILEVALDLVGQNLPVVEEAEVEPVEEKDLLLPRYRSMLEVFQKGQQRECLSRKKG